jgi:hypothetical protein
VNILPSSGERRLREIKRRLVLELYLREGAFWVEDLWEGAFWAEIKDARERWGIKPEVRLPPAHLPVPHPKGDSEQAQEWVNELHSFQLAFVSDSWRYQRATDWDRFFGACVLYDPPELDLALFAEYGGTKPEGLDRLGSTRDEETEGSHMIASPIRWLPTLSQLSERLGEFYDALIEELGRRYVEPTGKDTIEAINEILLETGLLKEYQSSFELDEQRWDLRPYILLDDLPQEKDVVNALRLVRATMEKDSGGKPPRDRLLAIKLAALHDEHNFRYPENRRRWRWTYERLVDEFGLDEAEKVRKVDKEDVRERKRRIRIGERYVKLGQDLRMKRKRNSTT